MPKKLRVALTREQSAALRAGLAAPGTSARQRQRLLMVCDAANGDDVAKIAFYRRADVQTVRRWLKAFGAGGVAALADRPRSGHPPATPLRRGGLGGAGGAGVGRWGDGGADMDPAPAGGLAGARAGRADQRGPAGPAPARAALPLEAHQAIESSTRPTRRSRPARPPTWARSRRTPARGGQTWSTWTRRASRPPAR